MKELFEFLKKEYFYYCKNAIEDFAYSIEAQIFKFCILGVVIHPEMQSKILRSMMKDLAQLDLPFLSYDQKTVIFLHFSNNRKNLQFFWL